MSISTNARAWLRNASRARVLHLFDEACNLISEEAGVLSIVSRQIGDGPFSLVLPWRHLPDHISASAVVSNDANGLHIGEVEIDVQAARVWDPRPDWPTLRRGRQRVIASLHHLVTTLGQFAPPDSLAVLVTQLSAPAAPLAKRLQLQARDPANELVSGLHSGDPDRSREAAADLGGLGGGLTPAGDDWIVGCLLGSWLLWEDDKARMLAGAVEEVAGEGTTPLSRAMVQAASRGECAALWHELLLALLAAEAAPVRSVGERIIARGHTSGADALSGFVAVLRGGIVTQS